MGAYKTYSDVPDRHHLSTFQIEYRDRDVWNEYLEDAVWPEVTNDEVVETIQRHGKYWKDHTNNNDTHHALAKPEVVESYSKWLCGDKAPITACRYWAQIDNFYQWLLWHTDHPHRYNPVRMAAVEYDHTGEIWEWQYRNNGGRDL